MKNKFKHEGDSKLRNRLNLSKLIVFYLVAWLLIASLAFAATGDVDTAQPWHTIQQIAKSNADRTSIDKDADEIIDEAKTLTLAIILGDVNAKSNIGDSSHGAVLNLKAGVNKYAAIDFFNGASPVWGIGKDDLGKFYIDKSGVGNALTIKDTNIDAGVDPAKLNVGIGVADPNNKLEVAGKIFATGDVCTNLAGGKCLSTLSFTELDPKVGAVTSGKWCVGDGTAVQCTQNTPVSDDGDWVISGTDMYSSVAGNIGIGAPIPKQKLDVTGSIATSGVTRIDTSGVGTFSSGTKVIGKTWTAFTVEETSGGTGAGMYLNKKNSNSVGDFSFRENNADRWQVSFRSAGQNDRLDIANYYTNDGAWGGSYAPRITITKEGNVGVGKVPDADIKLDVDGTLKATKLTVGTIDPVYEIDGKKYATYVSDYAGGVAIETSGKINIKKGIYEIDFNNLQKGSDLWLFWQASNKNIKDISIILTPGFDGKAWYTKKENSLIINADKDGEVSYRLTAPRKDYEDWPNEIK